MWRENRNFAAAQLSFWVWRGGEVGGINRNESVPLHAMEALGGEDV
jgi:hypothetical protein